MESNEMINFYYAQGDCEYVVEEVPNNPLLICLGIYPKSIIKKNYQYKLGGPVIAKVCSKEVAIGKDVAQNIKVRKVAGK